MSKSIRMTERLTFHSEQVSGETFAFISFNGLNWHTDQHCGKGYLLL